MSSDNDASVVPGHFSGGRPLKRVVSMTGAYGYRNHTVKSIQELKGKEQLTQTLPFLVEEAVAAEEAEVDMLNVRYDPKNPVFARDIRRAAPNTFMSFVMPILSVTSEKEVLEFAFRAMEDGADSIICQSSIRFIEALAETGVPVQGHVGLVPRKSTWTGGLRAVGKTLNEAMAIFRLIKELESAGAWAVECEVIPSAILREISQRTSLVTVSIGSGSGGDVQLLFAQDILGDGKPPFPRHSKQYCNLLKLREEMQKMRVKAFKEFVKEVQSGVFPSSEYEVELKNDIVKDFVKQIEVNTKLE